MKVEEIIAKAKKLPANPEILPKLLNVLQDGNSTYWQIAKLINLDQALTSQVLTWSNSGYYGYVRPSVDVEEAISRVGLNEIYKLVGIEMGKRLLDQPASFYALDSGELFESSLAAAYTMEAIAMRCGADGNVAYTVGLLHGIGKIVIDQVFEEQYTEVFAQVDQHGKSVSVAEKEVLGYSHAEIGQALLKKWNFQSQVHEPIGYQYQPFMAERYAQYACMMNIAHYVVAGIGQSAGRNAMALELEPKAMEKLGIPEPDLQMMMMDVMEKIEIVKSQLLSTPDVA